MKGVSEICVENSRFEGWKVRYYKTENNDIEKEYTYRGGVVDVNYFNKNDNYWLLLEMLQSDDWE